MVPACLSTTAALGSHFGRELGHIGNSHRFVMGENATDVARPVEATQIEALPVYHPRLAIARWMTFRKNSLAGRMDRRDLDEQPARLIEKKTVNEDLDQPL